MKFKKLRLKIEKGFTLVELLIVIAIIGILAAALISMINPAQQQRRARNTRIQQELSKISEAAESYAATFGTYRAVNANGVDTGGDLANAACWNAWAAGDGTQSFAKGNLPNDPTGVAYEIQCQQLQMMIRGRANSATDFWHYSTGDGRVHLGDWHW